MAYLERYGDWAGNPRGRPADLTRCCESVMDNRSPISHQCSRKRGYGPDGAYCKQHDPEAVKLRQEQSAYKFRLSCYNDTMRRWSDTLPLIRAIAEGHNDPRGLCQQWLDERADKLTPPQPPQGGE